MVFVTLTSSSVVFGEAILRTSACSTLSQVAFNGRDYTIRSYAVRHNLEWRNPNEEFDLQLHEQLSDTFPPFATVVRNLAREAKGQDGRVLSGSESAQVLGLYGTEPGPVVFPTSRVYTMSGLLMMQESAQMKSAAKLSGDIALPKDKFRTTSS